MRAERCETCAWFVPISIRGQPDNTFGDCRIDPPKLVQYADEHGAEPSSEWPAVPIEGFCGKWKALE